MHAGSGRKLVGKTFLAPTPGTTHALNYYRSIRAANADVTQRSYSAIVGSYDEESTAELSTVSQLDKMPVIGYKATSDDLGLKVGQTHTEQARCLLILWLSLRGVTACVCALLCRIDTSTLAV